MKINHATSAAISRFDNSTNGFAATNVQKAIEEVKAASQPITPSCLFINIHQILTNEEFACDGISRISLNRISNYSSPRVILVDQSPSIMKNFIDRINV